MNIPRNVPVIDLEQYFPSTFAFKDATEDFLLAYCRSGAEGLFISAGEYAYVSSNKRAYRVSDRQINGDDMKLLIESLFDSRTYTSALSGEFRDRVSSVKEVTERGAAYRLRWNIQAIETGYGNTGIEASVRLIPSEVPDIASLPHIDEELRDALTPRRVGIVLMCGATGSGKTTTMAAMMHHLLVTDATARLLTYEHPVEFNLRTIKNRVALVNQTEVGEQVSSFADGLKSAMRRQPTHLYIGEVRDAETAMSAISFADSGHGVMTTLHTDMPEKALNRIVNMCPTDIQSQVYYSLVPSVKSIVSQRLVPCDPTKNNGRSLWPIVSFIQIDEVVQRRLTDCAPTEASKVISQMMPTHGRTYRESIERALDGNIISDLTATSLLKEIYGGGHNE
ncbi:hypothetical protein C4K68_09660 [Pokkaliibacter plantistimulans]|uniref:Bacterial type II secretion system protein E domain-containing protein n=1 Tax=Proteobacteria bacterium 228 TaxID=2083153 RepID=A0A2S5KSH9_9PROT|nr:ATPase, T2SS/T4P/T4SS family [Pokkaliibacter plantistimulans]PPC77615.1 hypothetical protein C4K68_09660 [Pokkaliibacter plantistimulans]